MGHGIIKAQRVSKRCSVNFEIFNPDFFSKWKGDNRQLYSLCIGPYSKTLLGAGKMIRLWDLKTKTVLQVRLDQLNLRYKKYVLVFFV